MPSSTPHLRSANRDAKIVRKYPQTRAERPRAQFDLKPEQMAAAEKCAVEEDVSVASIARKAFLNYLRHEGFLPKPKRS